MQIFYIVVLEGGDAVTTLRIESLGSYLVLEALQREALQYHEGF
jgi:hypothetical protein